MSSKLPEALGMQGILQTHDLLIPQWPAPTHVQAACSTRSTGCSPAPWDSLNLGLHVGDDPQRVRANRQRLHHSLQARGATQIAYLEQVHGTQVHTLQHTLSPAQGHDAVAQADALVTRLHGQACAIMVADCLPVLMTDAQGLQVGAAHAGWRGLVGVDAQNALSDHGVLEALVNTWTQPRIAPPQDLLAWLGPCIGPQHFEVGESVLQAFTARDPHCARYFTPHPDRPHKWYAHLPHLARHTLQRLGVQHIYGNDGSDAWCTVTQSQRFFSHRRDTPHLGNSGRFAACIWRVG